MSCAGYCCADAGARPAATRAAVTAASESLLFIVFLSLWFELGDTNVVFPILDVLEEARLALFRRGDPGIAAETVEKRLGLVGRQDRFEPAIDLIDDRARRRRRHHGG